MSKNRIEKLIDSIGALEQSIALAKETFERTGNEQGEMLERIGQYEKILQKQRVFAEKLSFHMAEQDWEQVARYLKLINGLSTLINEDAQTLIDSVLNKPTKSPEKDSHA